MMIMNIAARGSAAFSYYNAHVEGRSVFQVISKGARNVLEFCVFLFKLAVGVNSAAGLWIIFLLLVIAGIVSYWRRGGRIAVTYCAFYLSLVATIPEHINVEVRHAVPLLPLLYIFAWRGLVSAHALGKRLLPHADRFPRGRETLAAAVVAVIAAINIVGVGKELARNFSPDFYARYSHGKWVDFISLARNAADVPVTGRVMVTAWGPTHMLTGWEALRTPWRVPEKAAGMELLRKYCLQNDIRVIIGRTDDTGAEWAMILHFIDNGPLRWKEFGRFGKLVVYLRGENAPGGLATGH